MFTLAAACTVLIIAVFMDSSYFEHITQPDVQVVLGTLVIAIVLFDNVIAGLIIGIAVLIMYMRVYVTKFGITINLWNWDKGMSSNAYPMKTLFNQHVTAANLKDAQNNVFNDDDYDKEMVGVKGVYGEAVYSAQGTDKLMPGLDATNVYLPSQQLNFKN
jgi:hypothetical protein